MNEKNVFIVCFICLLLFILTGCCTRAGICDNGSGAGAVREYIAELSDKQADTAITSEQLNGTVEGARKASEQLSSELTGSREQSEKVERSITDGAGELESLAAILQRIRKRDVRHNSETAGNNR